MKTNIEKAISAEFIVFLFKIYKNAQWRSYKGPNLAETRGPRWRRNFLGVRGPLANIK
jgi:hypothetical protein